MKPSKRGEKVKFDIESRQMSATGMNKGLELGIVNGDGESLRKGRNEKVKKVG